jgi:hypothetical protein
MEYRIHALEMTSRARELFQKDIDHVPKNYHKEIREMAEDDKFKAIKAAEMMWAKHSFLSRKGTKIEHKPVKKSENPLLNKAKYVSIMNKKDNEQLELNYLEFLLQTAQTTDLSLPEKKMTLRIIQTSDKLDLRIWEEIKSADIIISDQLSIPYIKILIKEVPFFIYLHPKWKDKYDF